MSGQFGVEPTALTDLAGKFDLQAKGLDGPIRSFAATSAEVGEAFGILGACDGAMEKYLKLLNSTVKALSQLPQVLTSDAERLRINASQYEEADQTAVGHLQSVPRYQGV
ncbi:MULTISPECIES: type VII secretion target [Streptomyces]|uniref:type VII secretion target n=1 Tax=Streptomyces TaxID=1883 RepID=UPI0019627571|nr:MULTISPECIES: type VII secretion target [Streptomyces]QRX93701.1 ESX-1 secretion-associated protein [Streptomyces noursei]UJB43377.1 ESX-1 secretion-associated protein [Streptomyces sp. A1-5]